MKKQGSSCCTSGRTRGYCPVERGRLKVVNPVARMIVLGLEAGAVWSLGFSAKSTKQHSLGPSTDQCYQFKITHKTTR